MKSVIVIPVLNEEKTIVDVLGRTKKNIGRHGRIIVVDNNSTDSSVSVVRKHFPGVEIISEKKRGKGNALRKGFRKALKYESDFVVMLDADGEKDPADIPVLLEKARKTGADMVIGYRDRMRSKRREVLEKFENWWLRFATGYDIRDGSCGFNVFRREALVKLDLKTGKFEIEPEILLECRRNRMMVVEHPVVVPTISPTRVSKKHIREINRFFDRWVLEWMGSGECDLSTYKKIFLKFSCNLGLLIFR